jgi:hypothetical protein
VPDYSAEELFFSIGIKSAGRRIYSQQAKVGVAPIALPFRLGPTERP